MLNRVRTLTRHQAESYGCTYEIREGIPGAVLVNDDAETARAAEIAIATFGEDRVVYPGPMFLASEDFAFMLQQRKGTYCFVGNGPGPMVHHPQYVFNKNILADDAALLGSYCRGLSRVVFGNTWRQRLHATTAAIPVNVQESPRFRYTWRLMTWPVRGHFAVHTR